MLRRDWTRHLCQDSDTYGLGGGRRRGERREVRARMELTFRLDTRSAVSRRVSWLIWSTMAAILGFSGAAAAASVELYRLAAGAVRVTVEGRSEAADRNWRAQRWAAYLQERDMMAKRCRGRGRMRRVCCFAKGGAVHRGRGRVAGLV